MLDNEQLAAFHRNGFVLLRGVFPPEEVHRIRAQVEEAAKVAASRGRILRPLRGECIPVGDLCTLGALDQLLFDERIVDCARRALGASKLVYYGDSSIMVGGQLRGFHKDNADRYDGGTTDWSQPYEMVRFGIYLDDHDRWSGGLKVRVGSHLTPDISTGQIYNVPSRAGDLVMWNLRTTHSGAAKRLRMTPWVALHPRAEERLPDSLFREAPAERLAVFLTLARDGAHLQRYIAKHNDDSNYKDNYLSLSWRHSRWTAEHDARAKQAGIEFRRPCADYGKNVDDRDSSADGLVAGQLVGERPPPGRLARLKQRLESAANEMRGTF